MSQSQTIIPIPTTFDETYLTSTGFLWIYTPDSPNSIVSNQPHITSCSASKQIFGGPLIFGPNYWVAIQSTYSLPPHYSLSFSFNFVRFGFWTDLMGLSLNVVFGTWTITLNFANNYNGGIFGNQVGLCGGSATVETQVSATNLAHFSNSLIFLTF